MTETRALSAMDASMLAMETAVTPLHMGGASIFRLPGGAGKDFVRQLYERWRRFPVQRSPFNYRLVRSARARVQPRWEILDGFAPQDHFFHLALPHPGDDHELEQLVARIHSRQLDRIRPLWEIYLIEGLSGGRFAMYTKIHHALADGATAMRIFMDQFSEDPKATRPPVWAMRGRPTKRATAVATPPPRRSLISKLPTNPGDALELLGRVTKGIGNATALVSAMTEVVAPKVPAPDTIFNGPITARREVGQAEFNFARVKALSKALDCTINDLALAVCSGALRRYMDGIDALPAEPLVCVVPISLNKAGNAEGGNTVTAAPVSLCTDVDDVRERFEAIRLSMREVKARLARMPPEIITVATAILQIPVVIEQVSGRWLLPARTCNMILSNVPGPRTRLYMCGAEFMGSIPLPMILRGMGLNITITSLLDRIWFSFTTCPDVAPHIERLGPLIEESFEELEQLMTRPSRRAPVRRRQRTKAVANRRRRAGSGTVGRRAT